MNAPDSKAEIFDVFLCHNSEDKPAVREISKKLVKEGIKPWLDIEQIPPGSFWQTELGEQINSIKSAAVFVGNSGIGPWQNEEIQAFLSQFIERKCPVIPTILGSATTTPELPWTLKNRHRVDFRVSDPDPLKQLIWGITRQKPAARENLIPGKDELATSKRTSFEPRHSPPLAHRPDEDQIGQLEILRRRVKEYWVDGVLEHSLHNEVLISLRNRATDEFLDAPWKYTVEVSDGLKSTPLENRDVKAIYDATGLLLILGEPGSGKTTTLLDLARTLLERAGKDIKERVPVVLNLSNWKKKRPLADWIAGELSQKYRVSVKIARSWLQKDYLVPLLDGLDEVPTALQPDCVAAINDFIDRSQPSGLVVCCRLLEYQWLPKRLKLNGAICLQPLSSEEVSKYLAEGGPKLAALHDAVDTDPVLQELAQMPLMLSMMSLACQGADANELARQNGDSPEERRKQIFGLYVEQMFQRKGTAFLLFPKEKIISWLSWLAGKMREHSQAVFLVEALQPRWLGTRAKWVAYGIVVALSLGLIFALLTVFNETLKYGLGSGLIDGRDYGVVILVGVGLGCWSESSLKNGLLTGLLIGLIVGTRDAMLSEPESRFIDPNLMLINGLTFGLMRGLVGGLIGGFGVRSLKSVTLVETVSWNWNQFWKRVIPGLIVGLSSGLICGLIGRSNLKDSLGYGLIFGVIFGLVFGLVGGFTDRVNMGKASVNQGIKLSLKNSLGLFFVAGLTLWLSVGLTLKSISGLGDAVSDGPFGLYYPSFAGVIVGLNRGGSAVIKHYALRLILWLNGYTPFNFVKFLDQCAMLILLKKVGGGYIFIHRMLLEYFADLNPPSTKAGDVKTGSVGP